MANLNLKPLRPVNPSKTPIPKPAPNLPKAQKLSKPATQKALSPLFGQKKPRPVIQSTPTRTPTY